MDELAVRLAPWRLVLVNRLPPDCILLGTTKLTLRSLLRTPFQWAACLLGAVGFVIALPIVLAVAAVKSVLMLYSTAAFARRRNGCVYLVCTSRRGWYDFLRNNVAPILPEYVTCLWPGLAATQAERTALNVLKVRGIADMPRPYFVKVVRHGDFPTLSLNRTLQDLKPCAVVSGEVQGLCRSRIEAVLLELEHDDSASYEKSGGIR